MHIQHSDFSDCSDLWTLLVSIYLDSFPVTSDNLKMDFKSTYTFGSIKWNRFFNK